MRTLIISDLHLGSTARVDVLRNPALRERLWQALAGVERLVLLGDVLELRHGPRREALAAARPFFEELGRVFPQGEIVVVAGNHDHALIEPWLLGRGELQSPEPLALEQRFGASEASSMLEAIAGWVGSPNLTVAYPGLWVRDDVYATHGHYLDCHLTVPTMERLGIGAMTRVLRRPEGSFRCVDDYEAVMGPVFAWIDSVAQREQTGDSLNGQSTVRVWRALRGGRDDASRLEQIRSRLLAGAFPLAVAALNRAGIGRFAADISSGELRRAGLRAMAEVTGRLNLGEAHVIFGHTHRAGPLAGESEPLWSAPGAARLMNAGCWTYDSYFLTDTPGESPYWPGGCVIVDDDGPPVLERLLVDRTHEELRPVLVG
jgi:Calcineurin-like phosphoesterase